MTASSVIIEELSGRRRRLGLVGPGLPLRGAPWPVEQRLVTKYYPGSSEATQQLLGPVDLPSDWEGVWNTTRLISAPQTLQESGASIQIVRAFDLAEVFEDIVRSGSLLRVTWTGDEGKKIQREGRIGPYTPKWDRVDDLRWSAQFVWTGRGGTAAKVAPVDASVEASIRAMNQSLADLQSALLWSSVLGTQLSDLPADVPRLWLDDLAALAAAPSAILTKLTDSVARVRGRVSQTVGVAEQFRAIPDQLANQAMISARDTRDTAKDVTTRLSRIPSESFSSPGVGVGRTLRLVSQSTRAHRAALATEASALQVEHASRRAQTGGTAGRRVNESGPSDAVTTHIVRSGETFASISRQYYGTADLAGSVAQANRYPRYQIAPAVGARLLIPARPTAGA